MLPLCFVIILVFAYIVLMIDTVHTFDKELQSTPTYHIRRQTVQPVESDVDLCREFNCKGLTTCVENRCQTFLRGDPCEVDTQDVKLYFDFYYLKEIEVNTTCWDDYVTYWIRELGDSPGMTEAEYESQKQDTLRRVEKNGDDWAAMGRVVRRKGLEACRTTMNSAVVDYVIPLFDPNDPALKRTLRSFEKYGLLDIVRNVYVITNDYSTHAILAQQYEGLQVLALQDIQVPYDLSSVKHEAWKKIFAAPFIKGLAENYLMGPDDTILNTHFKRAFVYNSEKGLPYAHSFGSSRTGNNMGFRNIAPNHGPSFLNKCAMRFIIREFKDKRPPIDPVSVCIGMLNRENLLAGMYGYHDRRFRQVAGVDYFSECHTNGGCRRPKFDDLFVNIQGNGISIEYTKSSSLKNTFDQWFESQFPTPSRFEKGQVYSPTRCEQIRARAVEMVEDDGFVPTGDIDDMWIRDSAAQVHPMLDSHPELERKVIEKQAFYIEFDPYANSYGRTFREPSILGRHGWVTTRNYELDSGAYFIRLVHTYWKRTGEKLGAAAIGKLLSVWRVEQHHANSLYRYDELQDGVGTPVDYTGMTWTGFRPSDDKCMYHYHIPDNVFAAVALGYLEEMGYMIGTLREDIIHGIHMFGVQDGIYCYEVDGLGNCNKMDDANLPSLLSLPYLDPDQTVYDRDIWERTRAVVLSDANPYYYSGKYRGVGSPHTPYNHVWHLSLIVQAMQGDSEALKTLEETASEPGHKASAFHESFHVDNPNKYTRKWFAWADALYLELCDK